MHITWAQFLKRVFGIDIETFRGCGAVVRIIACFEDPAVIEKMLTHLNEKGASAIAFPNSHFFANRILSSGKTGAKV